MLQGLLPSGDLTAEQLETRLIEGRFCEIRMLFYVGKDLVRWVEQCLDFANSYPEFEERHYNFQSFVSYLIFKTPAPVQAKLRKWGVADYRSIFSRAIALNSLFNSVPEPGVMSDEFVKSYYRYTDAIFKLDVQGASQEVNAMDFDFDLFASGEYSRMLELEWGQDSKE